MILVFPCFVRYRYCRSTSEVRWENHLLIAYFRSNMSAKTYQNRFMCIKILVRQVGWFFGGTQCNLSGVHGNKEVETPYSRSVLTCQE